MEQVEINEVGLRDGLQMHPEVIPTEGKLRLAQALVDAGLGALEAASFVSPKAVPQMADAAQLLPRLPAQDRIGYSVLVPNLKGLHRAREAGAREVSLVLSATDTMNQKNIGKSLQETRQICAETVRQAQASGLQANAYIAVAFECPFEGRVAPERVAALSSEMFDAGADRVIIADTIGAAAPSQVRALFDALLRSAPVEHFACHFHDTRAFALSNVWESLEAGVRRFDSSIGGLGGCPFSPGSSGNLATEDLLMFLEQSGYQTGLSLDGVLAAVEIARELTGRELGGRVTPYLRAMADRNTA